MKVFEKDLVVGDEYYLDAIMKEKGIFVGIFDRSVQFWPTCKTGYGTRSDGTVGFPTENCEYEEV